MQLGEIRNSPDFAHALRGESGTFSVTKPGLTLVVVCAQGHSIKSIRMVGAVVPTPYATSDWEIEKINNSEEAPFDGGDLVAHRQPAAPAAAAAKR